MILYVQLTVSNTYFLMFQYDIVVGSVFESLSTHFRKNNLKPIANHNLPHDVLLSKC